MNRSSLDLDDGHPRTSPSAVHCEGELRRQERVRKPLSLKCSPDIQLSVAELRRPHDAETDHPGLKLTNPGYIAI